MKANTTFLERLTKIAFPTLLLVFMLAFIASINAQNVNNITKSTTHPTIQAAIDAVTTTNGDILVAVSGTYPENVVVNKELTIRGNNSGTPGNGTRASESIVSPVASNNTAFNIVVNNVTIDGFKIANAGTTDAVGVSMGATTSNVQVINNIITNNSIGIYANSNGPSFIRNNLFDANNTPGAAGGTGIYSEFTKGLEIEGNEFKNHAVNSPVTFAATGPGVHSNLLFNKNYLHDNEFGIYVLAVNNSDFTNNTFNVQNATAISFAGADNNISVRNNFFIGGPRGVRVRDDGYNFGPNSSITVNENSFKNIYSDYYIGIEPGGTPYANPPLNATCNWYSTTNEAVIASKIKGPVTFKPYLINGTDDSYAPGFQPKPYSCKGPIDCDYLKAGEIKMDPSTPVKGQKKHTIYLGYGPQCVKLKAPSVSGTKDYTYLWSTGETKKEIKVCPTTTTTYTLTITDKKKGCQIQREFTVYVIDVRCGKYNDKVLICDKKDKETECATKEHAKDHLKRGDKLGPCHEYDVAVEKNHAGYSQSAKEVAPAAKTFKASSYPNPFNSSTRIRYMLPYDSRVSIKVYDFMGREVATLFEGNRAAGEYYADFAPRESTASGIYLYKISAKAKGQEFNQTGKMIKLK